MSTFKIETLAEALRLAQKVDEQTTTCTCPDDPHQNALHDLAADLADPTGIIGPIGMRPDGTADPRVEAGADALVALGVPVQQAWDYADAVLAVVFS